MARHRFVPTAYHTTLGPHDPVLTIESGDRVFTTTVDAGGFDANDDAVTPAGNPQTGPFRVTGAEPGDTLVVHLEQIRPNRARGYSKTWVAANVLDPGHPTLPGDLPPSIDWAVDVEAGVASPTGVPELADWRVPLAPMIGCFGVAPKRQQAISTATSERHGGNMDWNGFQAGVTTLFPVFEPGALFSLGDVHAVQGDGEIVGTGIEISADVVFRLELFKGRTIGWPRARTAAFIATLGNARPLDEAENGIHHTVQYDLWKMILRTAHANDVQVLATTHSWDCVRGFAYAAAESEESNAVLIRLDRDDRGLRAVEYSEEDLKIAADQGIEVR